ncbi:CMRF35-like molecule 2 isoform X2 [Peromyscus leucopus]|uniref:CMRF35-like molecule 2 isoform X2 n=1 Tax=Peromyscus leucopus TaxID=10041 RepID=UPI00188564F1|nr:CMRF35-like molecule 2 isoform X2 [Peromyscus leucopus]
MWLCPGLLLFCLQGCLSLTGPGSVSGYVGGSLHVQCQYGKSYKNHLKYWCRGEYDTKCKTIVETKGNGEEKKNGRVSIRDHTENFTMTVTMENLSEDDAGSYWSTTPMETTLPATTPTLPLVNTGHLRMSTTELFFLQLWSLLSSIHFQVLVFLKLPLFLSMLCAVFWVNRLQKIPGGNLE